MGPKRVLFLKEKVLGEKTERKTPQTKAAVVPTWER